MISPIWYIIDAWEKWLVRMRRKRRKKNFFGMPQIKKSKNTNVLQSLKEAVFKISSDSDDRGEVRH